MDVPVVVTEPDADDKAYQELKDQIIKSIISNRLIKTTDIDNFIEQTKRANHVDEDKFSIIVEMIKQEIGENEE